MLSAVHCLFSIPISSSSSSPSASSSSSSSTSSSSSSSSSSPSSSSSSSPYPSPYSSSPDGPPPPPPQCYAPPWAGGPTRCPTKQNSWKSMKIAAAGEICVACGEYACPTPWAPTQLQNLGCKVCILGPVTLLHRFYHAKPRMQGLHPGSCGVCMVFTMQNLGCKVCILGPVTLLHRFYYAKPRMQGLHPGSWKRQQQSTHPIAIGNSSRQ